MKKMRLFLLFVLLFLSHAARTQENPPERSDSREEMAQQRQAEYQKLLISLDLSEEQAIVLKEINEEYRQKMNATRDENQGDRQNMRSSIQKLREGQLQEIKDILTADQFAIYSKFMEDQRNRPRGRRNRNGN